MSNGSCKYKIVNFDFEHDDVMRKCSLSKSKVCKDCERNCISFEPKSINYNRLEGAIFNTRI